MTFKTCFQISIFLLLAAACAGPAKQLPFLAEQYSPRRYTPPPNRRPLEPTLGVVAEGQLRSQQVPAPNGKVYRLRWRNIASSIGPPNKGELLNGNRLPKRGVGYKHIAHSPFGTDEAVVYLQFAAWVVKSMFSDSPPIVIGDLSKEGGGHLAPHRSHQSGRDADLSWYRSNNRPLRWFRVLKGEDLDVEKSWIFIEALLRTNAVKYIFVDKGIQERLYRQAIQHGWSELSLQRVFQYPTGNRRTLIRHEPGHKNHFHVRFKCSRDDQECVP